MYVTVQICWSYEPDRPSMCVEMLSEWKLNRDGKLGE
jgi:hypothetical protein